MADDLNRLLIKIQADTSQLSSALQRAEAGVANSSKRIERTLDRNSAKFQSWASGIGRQFKSILAGYVGLETVRKGIEAIGDVASIKDSAAAAALSTETFQELKFAAQQAGVSVGDLSTGLNKFATNMADARLNTGQFDRFLIEQAPALRDALVATKSQAQAINVLSDFMAGLSDEGERATLAQKAFGQSGTNLIPVLDKGAASLKTAADRAHELNLVLGDDLTESAKKTEKQFAELEAQVTSMWQRMVVGAAQGVKSIWQAIEDGFKNHNFTFAGDRDPLGVNSLLDALFGKSGNNFTLESSGNNGLLGGLSGIAAKLPAIVPPQKLRPKPDFTGRNAMAGLTQQFDASNGNIQQVLQDQYDSELQQWKDMLDKKQISEQQFAEARTQLGIIMLNQQKENLGAETQLQRDYYTATRDLIDSTFMDSFSNALQNGKFKASEFFNSLLQGFAKITTEVLVLKPLLNSLFSGSTGSNGLGGLLNGLIGGVSGAFGGSAGGWGATVIPARAAGGPGVAGQSYLTGEHGPEIFTPSANGSFGGSGIYARGASSSVTNNYIDARGADIGVAQRLQAVLASQRNQQSPVSAVRQASKRFPTRG